MHLQVYRRNQLAPVFSFETSPSHKLKTKSSADIKSSSSAHKIKQASSTQRNMQSKMSLMIMASEHPGQALSSSGKQISSFNLSPGLNDEFSGLNFPANFPAKLYALIEESKQNGLSHVISWRPNGKTATLYCDTAMWYRIWSRYSNVFKLSHTLILLQGIAFAWMTNSSLKNLSCPCKWFTGLLLFDTGFPGYAAYLLLWFSNY